MGRDPRFDAMLIALRPKMILWVKANQRAYARDAEDLVQDALVRALAKWEQFIPGKRLDAWILTILRNLAIDQYREEQTLKRAKHRLNPRHQLNYPPNQEVALELKEVVAAIESLPASTRNLIRFICIEGNSYEEAAAILQVPVNTAKTWVRRARKVLRGSEDE